MLSLVARAVLIAALGGGAGWLGNALRPGGLRLAAFAPPTSCELPGAGEASGLARAVQVLPPAEAVRLCGDAGVLVADTRSAERFAHGHVAGAVHLPCGAARDAADRAVALAAGKHTLVVYGDATDDARPVAEALRERLGARPGVARVVLIEGGFPAWEAAGLACSSGACPDCKESSRR
jgi:rhodanese-related sulfurtransferase